MKKVIKSSSQKVSGLRVKSCSKAGFGGIGTGKLSDLSRRLRAYSRQFE